MRQVIIGQFAMFQHRVDMRQTGLWTIAHCNCHGTIERKYAHETNQHGITPSLLEKVPVGPSGPSSARRTGSRAPSSTVCVPALLLRFVLVKPGEQALTLIPVPPAQSPWRAS